MEENNSSGEYMHQVSVAQYFYGLFDRLLWMLLGNIECSIFLSLSQKDYSNGSP